MAPRVFAQALGLAGLSVLLACPSGAQAQCPVRDRWPGLQWEDATAETRASRAAEVAALEDYAFTLTGEDNERRGIRTDGVLVVHQGRVIFEQYGRGWRADQAHYTWSVTKSFTNVLTGIAVARGALTIDQSICDFITSARQENCAIRVRDLLEFASGLAWQEVYEDESNQASSVLAMLYGVGHQDLVRFVTDHRPSAMPGTVFRYSTGDSSLLATVVDRAMRASGLPEEWQWDALFERIGMTSVVLEGDTAGNPMGGSWLYATPRDLARFGYFLLNDGCWNGERILPDGWVRDSTSVSAPFLLARPEAEPGDVQGRQFWLNRPVPEIGQPTPWPDVPEDAFAARGHWAQSITVIPSRDLVVVRVADDRESPRPLDFNRFLSLAMAVAQ